jgi:hypothetical protein
MPPPGVMRIGTVQWEIIKILADTGEIHTSGQDTDDVFL